MMIIFEKKTWFEAKAKLLKLYHELTEIDFQYMPGEECNVPEKIRGILKMSGQEFYLLTKLTAPKRHDEEHIDANSCIIWTTKTT